jgi:hypothetical protein
MQGQRLAGLGDTFPPIANARWMGHPFVLGSLERTGNSNGKCGEDDEVLGLMDTT